MYSMEKRLLLVHGKPITDQRHTGYVSVSFFLTQVSYLYGC